MTLDPRHSMPYTVSICITYLSQDHELWSDYMVTSSWLVQWLRFEARFFSELLLLPMLAYFVLWSHDRVDDLEKIVTLHLWIFQLMLLGCRP